MGNTYISCCEDSRHKINLNDVWDVNTLLNVLKEQSNRTKLITTRVGYSSFNQFKNKGIVESESKIYKGKEDYEVFSYYTCLNMFLIQIITIMEEAERNSLTEYKVSKSEKTIQSASNTAPALFLKRRPSVGNASSTFNRKGSMESHKKITYCLGREIDFIKCRLFVIEIFQTEEKYEEDKLRSLCNNIEGNILKSM